MRAGPAVAHRRGRAARRLGPASRRIWAPSCTTCPASAPAAHPIWQAIKAADPDLILGSQALTPDAFPQLTAIAPTVFTGPPGAAWQDNLRTVGAATGRLDAANGLIDGFEQAADKTGADNDATHFQASVVQLTDTTMRVYGADNFPGSVLAAVGVDRPAAQRFTDKPYVEIGITDTDMENSPDFSHRRRRHRLHLVRLARGQGPRAGCPRQRRVEEVVGQPRQPGVRGQQRGVADR